MSGVTACEGRDTFCIELSKLIYDNQRENSIQHPGRIAVCEFHVLRIQNGACETKKTIVGSDNSERYPVKLHSMQLR